MEFSNTDKRNGGLRRVTVWVPSDHAEEFESFAKNLMEEYLSGKDLPKPFATWRGIRVVGAEPEKS